jgi:hypothetical protein
MPPRNATRQPPTPLPVKKMIVLGLILAANNSSIWMIFSFLPFMVRARSRFVFMASFPFRVWYVCGSGGGVQRMDVSQ